MGAFLHGCDYNPEQWLNRPDILSQDIQYMKDAGINEATLGIFSWSCYERTEGNYTFEWMDEIMDSMDENGIHVILATPSAARPPWMVKKYPEMMRVQENRVRLLYGDRENHCNSSEIFRDKVREIDEQLAKRYATHPALVMWHISNELYGTCHCQTCQKQFRQWLQKKYGTIDRLNEQYNGAFWSHMYNEWDEIESPSSIGDRSQHALALDYERFYSDLSIDFVTMEKEAIRKYCKDIPVTTNMHNVKCGVDYHKLAKVLDVTSWDSYPTWHCGKNKESEWENAIQASFLFDYCRSFKKQPFYLMECTPSNTNWAEVCKLKKPGMHLLSSMLAVACGSDSVQYFQWRKSRGAYEKFHGAVIGHDGTKDTRVFREVAEVGDRLQEIAEIEGAKTESKIALIYDWNNMNALEQQMSLGKSKNHFENVVREYYEGLVKNYVSVDVISQLDDFSSYELIVAPVLYLFEPDTDKKIREFVNQGGCFVMGAYSGLVNENDLVFEGFPPFGLQDVFGVSVEETDALCEEESNRITYQGKAYEAIDICDLLRNQGATVLSSFERDFYSGKPAITKNVFGKGSAYYVASRMKSDFLYQFLHDVILSSHVKRVINAEYADDIMIRERCKNGKRYLFLLNFSSRQRNVTVNHKLYSLQGYECRILVVTE